MTRARRFEKLCQVAAQAIDASTAGLTLNDWLACFSADLVKKHRATLVDVYNTGIEKLREAAADEVELLGDMQLGDVEDGPTLNDKLLELERLLDDQPELDGVRVPVARVSPAEQVRDVAVAAKQAEVERLRSMLSQLKEENALLSDQVGKARSEYRTELDKVQSISATLEPAADMAAKVPASASFPGA